MRRIALMAVTTLIVGAGHVNAAERRVPQGWLGVTADGPLAAGDDEEWNRMARSGVETVRTAFHWARVQPGPPGRFASSFDFRSTDALAIAAAQRGIALLPVVQAAPYWAAEQPGVLATPPANLDAVRRFFAALVDRYGPRGSLWRERPRLPRRPIRAWQVFNEPNLARYWSVQPFERGYVATLRAAERGIHGVDPGATVVLAGLTNTSWEALGQIYAAGGGGSFDAVAIHPYSSSPAKVVRIVRHARAVMRAHGDGELPIWVTEFSWPATAQMSNRSGWETAFGQLTTDVQQARLLNRTLARFVAARERLGIARAIWYTWLSRESAGSTNGFDYAGLRRERAGERTNPPALRVFRRWARRIEGCAKTANAQRCR